MLGAEDGFHEGLETTVLLSTITKIGQYYTVYTIYIYIIFYIYCIKYIILNILYCTYYITHVYIHYTYYITYVYNTMYMIGSLMRVGFGEAGANVIAKNLAESSGNINDNNIYILYLIYIYFDIICI